MTHRTCNILVADDAPDARLIMQSALRKAGFGVTLAQSGMDALQKFDEAPCDMVMLDVDMPGMDGYQTCAALRGKAGPLLPIVMVTGMDDVASIEAAYEHGATDFIAKPVNWTLLAHRVRYILRAAQALAELARSREQLAEAQRLAGLGSWAWCAEGDRVDASDEALRILGHERRPRGGAMDLGTFFERLQPADRQAIRQALLQPGGQAAGTDGAKADVEADCVIPGDAGATPRVVHVHACTRRGAVGLFHGTVQDITERAVAQERIRHMAYHDSLTGLHNRAWLNERLARMLREAGNGGGNGNGGGSVALMLLDLDRFKRINDTLGHSVGDQLLCAVAQRLSQRLRRGDTPGRAQPPADTALARLGGDEFCIVASGVRDAAEAAALAQRVLDAFKGPFMLGEHSTVVTSSVGIALYPQDAGDAENLMKAADLAMYHSKHQALNGYAFYSPALSEQTLDGLNIETEMHRALVEEELVVHFQPIVANGGRSITGLEALLRWQHPARGLIMPERFIKIAEEAGLLAVLGEWVLHQACRQHAAWRAQGLAVPEMSVNVSADQIGRPDFVASLEALVQTTGIEPSHLNLEITESAITRAPDTAVDNLRRVRTLGIHVTLDDFGTGHSSLACLKRLPVDGIKLDRTFVAEITDDPRSAAIAGAVLELARRLSLTVVAEGIEDDRQAQALWNMGCQRAQGFHFHKPMAADKIPALLG